MKGLPSNWWDIAKAPLTLVLQVLFLYLCSIPLISISWRSKLPGWDTLRRSHVANIWGPAKSRMSGLRSGSSAHPTFVSTWQEGPAKLCLAQNYLVITVLKRLLMRVKEESEKTSLKLNINKTKIIASGPITSWHMKGKRVEAETDFLFLGSKITADGDCSHEIRRRLLLGRKTMTNLDSVLKSKDITLPWIFTGKTEAEAPILGHLMRTANSLEKTVILGKIEGRRKRGRQRMRWFDASPIR